MASIKKINVGGTTYDIVADVDTSNCVESVGTDALNIVATKGDNSTDKIDKRLLPVALYVTTKYENGAKNYAKRNSYMGANGSNTTGSNLINWTYQHGMVVVMYFVDKVDSACTITINNSTEKNIYRYGTTSFDSDNYLPAGSTVWMSYDNTKGCFIVFDTTNHNQSSSGGGDSWGNTTSMNVSPSATVSVGNYTFADQTASMKDSFATSNSFVLMTKTNTYIDLSNSALTSTMQQGKPYFFELRAYGGAIRYNFKRNSRGTNTASTTSGSISSGYCVMITLVNMGGYVKIASLYSSTVYN